MKTLLISALLLVALASSSCADLAPAAELGQAQIIALIADPPGVDPAQASTLSVVVAGPQGPIEPASIAWTVVGDLAALTDKGDNTWTFTPNGQSGLVLLNVQIELIDGSVLRGQRTLVVGESLRLPTISTFRVGSQGVLPGTAIQPSSDTTTLAIEVSPEPPETSSVSWFSNAGEIEGARESESSIVFSGSGVVFAVYRDGLGAVTASSFTVEQ